MRIINIQMMKADPTGIRLSAVFKGFKESSEDQGFDRIIFHDEHRI